MREREWSPDTRSMRLSHGKERRQEWSGGAGAGAASLRTRAQRTCVPSTWGCQRGSPKACLRGSVPVPRVGGSGGAAVWWPWRDGVSSGVTLTWPHRPCCLLHSPSCPTVPLHEAPRGAGAPLSTPGAQSPCPQLRLWGPRCPAQWVAQPIASVQRLMAPGSASDPEVCGWEMVPEQLSQPGGEWGALTFGLAVLEGGHALVLGEQSPAAGEAAGAPGLRLVRAHGAGLAGPEAVGGEGAGRALAWKTRPRLAQAGRRGLVQPCPQPSALICPWEGHQAPRLGWLGGGPWGREPGVPEPATHPSGGQRLTTVWLGQAWLSFSHQQEEKRP